MNSSDCGQAAWREKLVSYIRSQAKPVDKFSHQPRLYKLAATLTPAGSVDDDVLFAAAWLHDLGVFIGHRPEDLAALSRWDHVAYVFRVGPGVLEECGFPNQKIPAVLEVVRTHMPGSEPTTPEGIVLRDADILEQLGAVGILRTVSKVGRDTRFTTFADALRVLRKNLVELPGLLKLKRSRELAEPRIAILRTFLDAADQEPGGVPY